MLPRFFGVKITTPQEMSRIEKLALKEGCSEEAFILEAGKKIASCIMQSVQKKKVTLLVGKGNKGADAYAAGLALAEEGFLVQAAALYPPEACSEWNRKLARLFSKRGKIIPVWDKENIPADADLLVDGMLGTGFRGKAEDICEAAIRFANALQRPIWAIDLPSGLDGTTGAVGSVAIQAAATVALGMVKIGCFLREGWNHTGHLMVEDFGLPAHFVHEAKPIAYLPEPTRFHLPRLIRNRHKYQAGYVLGLAGSDALQGAPKLAGLAALRSGAGIVRIFHGGKIGEAPMELICQNWNEKLFSQELKRASSVFIGPGLGKKNPKWVKSLKLPAVFDADILQKETSFPPLSILTPHRGEMLRLLGLKEFPQEEDFLVRCHKFAEKKKVILVLKGAPTFLFAYHYPPLILPYGDPGMATAGSGDVLTGVIAALLAQGMDCYEAAALGIYLHGKAGEMAANKKTSYGMIARDLIEYLPYALGGVQQ